MAGLKQHHLPQFLLRGFSREAGANAQVTVYTRARGAYRAATQGVAAQRAFYSARTDASGSVTLDDKITAHESGLAPFVARLRRCAHESAVCSMDAARAVAHFGIRTAHFRLTVGAMIAEVVEYVGEQVTDPAKLGHALGLDASEPSDLLRNQARESWREHRTALVKAGFVQYMQFERFLFQHMKSEAGRAAIEEQVPFMSLLMERARSRSAEIAKKAHTRALDRTLAPEPRVKALRAMVWTVQHTGGGECILPDCAVLAETDEHGWLPFMLASGAGTTRVVLPIAHDRLLLGRRSSAPMIASMDDLNLAAAEASSEMFVALDQNARFESLRARIGHRIQEWLARAIASTRAE